MNVGAVILAAGFGTRLAPLTNHTPKPLIEVGGRPVASHLLDRLREVAAVDRVVVVVNGRHPQQWESWQHRLPSAPAVGIVSTGAVDEQGRNGAVVDLAIGLAALRARADIDWAIVLAGDNLLDEPLTTHLDAAVESGKPVVLCRDLGANVPPLRFGEITVDHDSNILRFREKPARPESPLAATCTYVLPGDAGHALDEYLRDGDADSPGSFIGWWAARRAIAARPLTGHYFDIGNHDTLAEARAAYA